MKVRQMMKRRQSARWFWATNPLWSQFVGRPKLRSHGTWEQMTDEELDWIFDELDGPGGYE